MDALFETMVDKVDAKIWFSSNNSLHSYQSVPSISYLAKNMFSLWKFSSKLFLWSRNTPSIPPLGLSHTYIHTYIYTYIWKLRELNGNTWELTLGTKGKMMQTTFMTSLLILFNLNSTQWIVQFGDVHISLPILGISGSGHNLFN
jgi:hypothetical protein